MNYKVDQELIDRLTEIIKSMRLAETMRQTFATEAFTAKMDRLEAEALAEIAAMVSTAKHKARGITEKLYGPDNDRIKKMFEAVLK